LVVQNFFEQADELRASFDRHFGDPDHNGPSHQIWDYWHVPRLYTYLRTEPRNIFPSALMDRFLTRLEDWALESLGLSQVTCPYLSLYVDGCGQGLHNDSGNGRWGYVYSLTKWDERHFHGGETLIFRDSNYWETQALSRPGAGSTFYDLVPARFNQLLVFDDRLIHAVPPIQGNMAPQEGRVVIHGHIREGTIVIRGSLAHAGVEALSEALTYVRSRLAALGEGFHGYASIRLEIESDGRVSRAVRLSERVYRTSPQAGDPGRLVSDLADFLATLRFPATFGKSIAIVPVPIG
jgi:hypothetical protein